MIFVTSSEFCSLGPKTYYLTLESKTNDDILEIIKCKGFTVKSVQQKKQLTTQIMQEFCDKLVTGQTAEIPVCQNTIKIHNDHNLQR